jgi:hypothetical protein
LTNSRVGLSYWFFWHSKQNHDVCSNISSPTMRTGLDFGAKQRTGSNCEGPRLLGLDFIRYPVLSCEQNKARWLANLLNHELLMSLRYICKLYWWREHDNILMLLDRH